MPFRFVGCAVQRVGFWPDGVVAITVYGGVEIVVEQSRTFTFEFRPRESGREEL